MASVAWCKWSCEACGNHSTMEKPGNQKRSAHLGEPEPAFWANPFSFIFFFWYNRVLLQVTGYQELQCACTMPLMRSWFYWVLSRTVLAVYGVNLASLRRLPQAPKIRGKEANVMLGAALRVGLVAAAGMEETTGDGGPAKVRLPQDMPRADTLHPLQLQV